MLRSVFSIILFSVKSLVLLVESGIPLESFLGSSSFLVYVLDITVGLVSSIYSFADDSKLLSIHLGMMTGKVQYDIEVAGIWCLENNLKLNKIKSPCPVFFKKLLLSFAIARHQAGLLIFRLSAVKPLLLTSAVKPLLLTSAVKPLLKRNASAYLISNSKLKLYKSRILQRLMYVSSVWFPTERTGDQSNAYRKKVTGEL